MSAQVPDSKGQNPEVVVSGVRSGSFYFVAGAAPAATPPPVAETLVSGTLKDAKQYYDSGNYRQAFLLYQQFAQQGDAEAQAWLGWLYHGGKGVMQDKYQAVAWYRKAAEQGNASGQANLGFMYEKGEGVAQEKAQAVAWYRKAAEQGNAWGQNNLGAMYEFGEGGLKKDLVKAAEWYRKAIANTDPEARKKAEENLARIAPQLPK